VRINENHATESAACPTRPCSRGFFDDHMGDVGRTLQLSFDDDEALRRIGPRAALGLNPGPDDQIADARFSILPMTMTKITPEAVSGRCDG